MLQEIAISHCNKRPWKTMIVNQETKLWARISSQSSAYDAVIVE